MKPPHSCCSSPEVGLLTSWRLLGCSLQWGQGRGRAGGSLERVLTYLSLGVRMIETPGPANCASCPENYCSACPVQRTKGPCDRSGQQCPARGGPGPAPIRPSLGHLLHPHPQLLSRASPGTPSAAGRKGGRSQPSQPGLLALAIPSSRLREAGQALGTCGPISYHKGGDGQCVSWCEGKEVGREAGAIWGWNRTPRPRR